MSTTGCPSANDAGVSGGRLNDLTFGLNWYLNPHVKFQFNDIHAFLNSPINGHSNADIAFVRAQRDFETPGRRNSPSRS